MPGAVQTPCSLKSNLLAVAASKRPVKAITSLIFSIISYKLPSGRLHQSQRMGPFLEGRPVSLFPERKLVCSIACVLLAMFIKVEIPPEFLYRLCREIMFPYCIMRKAVEVCYAQLIFFNVWRQRKLQFRMSICFSLSIQHP